MFEQLAALTDELDRLHEELPRIMASGDRRAARDAGRRVNELEPVVAAYNEWRQASQAADEARTGIEADADPEMKEMWRSELADQEAKAAELETKLNDLLIPNDPND